MKKKSCSVVSVACDRRRGNGRKGRTKGEGIKPDAFIQHQIATRGWVINPRTGLRVAVA